MSGDQALASALAYEDDAENRMTLEADDRATCFTHRTWMFDCKNDRLHANPVTGYNWCEKHWGHVAACRCRDAEPLERAT